jgi:DNA-binding transcriptional regulator YhcF (GntR family)
MLLRVDPSLPAALHEQVAAGIREAIAAGTVADGERLPAARVLAGSLDVNVHTVLRAYGDLRDAGLLELRRGRGAVVRASDLARRRLTVAKLAREFVDAGRAQGIPDTEILALVKEAQC